MSLVPLTPEIASQLGADPSTKGLLIEALDPEGVAADKGLAAGDVITEASQQPVASIADLKARIDDARKAGRKSVLVLIRREGEPRFVALPIGDAK